jgi:hypothetical protein
MKAKNVFSFDIAAMTVEKCLLHQTLTFQYEQNKNRDYTPVNTSVGKNFANVKEQVPSSVAGKETLGRRN